MSRRFVRVDLSDTARDFRPVALEPGVPLLDKPNGNAKILSRWLGGLAAEPEWDGESVNFYVRDEYGGRIEDVQCQPASAEELKGSLRGDVEAVRLRLGKVKPETATERAIHKLICAQFIDLIDNPNRLDRDNYFFRYRDVQNRWRLVWCWGYQRIDRQPAPPLVCTAADCKLLFVRRPGESLKCPSCEANLALAAAQRKPRKLNRLAGVLLLLVAALLAYWLLTRNQLQTIPDRWAGPAGSRIEFRVMTPGLFGLWRRDVSREVVVSSDNPSIVQVDRMEPVAVAAGPGQTQLHFALGKMSGSATVTVEATAQVAGAQQVLPQSQAKPAAESAADSSSKPAGESSSTPAAESAAATPDKMPDKTPAAEPAAAEPAVGEPAVAAGAKQPEQAPAKDALTLRDAKGNPFETVEMRVGDRLALGSDLTVMRGDADVSRQCQVTPMAPDVLKFDQEARTLTAMKPGQSPVKFSAGDKSLVAVAQVLTPAAPGQTPEPATDLKLEPLQATIHPGQGLFYRVTGTRGGKRCVLGAQDGVRLSTADSSVATAMGGTVVQGERVGRTEVVARVGRQQAKAVLNVTAGTGAPEAIVDVLGVGSGVGVVEGWGPDVEYFDSAGVHYFHPLVGRLGPGGEVIVEGMGGKVVVEGSGGEVVVGATDTLVIEPRRASVKVGESTPPYTVSLRGADGSRRVLKAAPLSTDESILVRDSHDAARFTARSLGKTQVRAAYGGREAFADVTVTGERFASIKTSISDQGDRDFEVSAEILGGDSDAALGYRAYLAGQTPAGDWTPSQRQGASRRVVVQSPRIKTGPDSASYQLIFEARDPRDRSIQKYPYTFRLGRTIEEVKDSPAR